VPEPARDDHSPQAFQATQMILLHP
jgi:hypothetical protein